MKRKRKRDKHGRFTRTWHKFPPKPILNIVDALSCSYWMRVGGGTLLLREIDYLQDIAKVFESVREKETEKE